MKFKTCLLKFLIFGSDLYFESMLIEYLRRAALLLRDWNFMRRARILQIG